MISTDAELFKILVANEHLILGMQTLAPWAHAGSLIMDGKSKGLKESISWILKLCSSAYALS